MFSRRTARGAFFVAMGALLGASAVFAADRGDDKERQQVSSSSSRSAGSRSASSTRSSARSDGTSSSSARSSSSSTASSSRQRDRRSAWRDRPNRHYGYGGHHYYGGYSWGYHYYPRYWGYWYTPWFWGPSVSLYYEPPPYGTSRGSDRPLGALDTDISPEKAEIFIDGRYVGVADDFDGFPTYLWLEEGTYDVAAYYPGFRTLSRQVSVYPGLVVDLDHRLEPGESVRPEDLASKDTAVRDQRLRRDQERQEDAAWRRSTDPPPPAGAPAGPAGPEATDASGRLILEVVPGDAAIYLDGRFLGTAEEVGRLHSGLIVEPGEHQLSVVRPGYGEKRRRFSLEPGEDLTLSIDLDD